MLTRLRLENFKAWREADVTLGRVTGFFGTNSAGKSSLLHLLLLLKQTRNATDRGIILDFGGRAEMVNLGTFADVVHRHDEERTIRWLLEWELPKSLRITDQLTRSAKPLLEASSLAIRYEVGFEKARLSPRELAYRFDGVDFLLRPKPDSRRKFELAADPPVFSFIRNPGRAWHLPQPAKTHLFPSQARSYYQNTAFLGDFELEYEKLMDSIYYLGPLREYPQREYHWAGSSPEDVGRRGERTIDAILAARTRGKDWSLGYRMHKKTFEGMIAYWLHRLGLIHDFHLEEIAPGSNLYRAMVKTFSSSVPTPLTDVGFGVSQVLPVLVLLYYVPEGSTVLLEQPEIHLHPSVQSGLADVMLNVATVRNVQIVLESHSEYLMRRLQRRVAEEDVSAEDVKLYFVSPRRGEAQVSDLLLNEWGEIENWPDKFFGDEMSEIAAISKASLKRRIAQSG
ncbi:DUF3696 domain-containing protein [Candidatus Palauibacter polyketidifaciens]|uniref:AAA family ATPase n=1 Tax=Candidatus Palauibacter polyketidifaciens TaxID=3056740 RepID=UPI0023847D7A|nr:DUF3696 domain-containing protein [Candidatus Palauibacter polyketidifaciens]